MSEVRIGPLRASYVRPSGPGPLPALVQVHEAFGPNADQRRITELLVDEGYAVLAPDRYSTGLRALCVARTVVDLLRGARAPRRWTTWAGRGRGWASSRRSTKAASA